MAFCMNCGAQIADGVAFCNTCGTAQNPAQIKPQGTPVQPSAGMQFHQQPDVRTQNTQQPQSPGGGKRTGLIIGLVCGSIALVAGIVVVLVLLFRGNDSSESAAGISATTSGITDSANTASTETTTADTTSADTGGSEPVDAKTPGEDEIYGEWVAPSGVYFSIREDLSYRFCSEEGAVLTFGTLEKAQGEPGVLAYHVSNDKGGAPMFITFSYGPGDFLELHMENDVYNKRLAGQAGSDAGDAVPPKKLSVISGMWYPTDLPMEGYFEIMPDGSYTWEGPGETNTGMLFYQNDEITFTVWDGREYILHMVVPAETMEETLVLFLRQPDGSTVNTDVFTRTKSGGGTNQGTPVTVNDILQDGIWSVNGEEGVASIEFLPDSSFVAYYASGAVEATGVYDMVSDGTDAILYVLTKSDGTQFASFEVIYNADGTVVLDFGYNTFYMRMN